MNEWKKNRQTEENKLSFREFQHKSTRYDISHERFVVPWQMEHNEKKEITIY